MRRHWFDGSGEDRRADERDLSERYAAARDSGDVGLAAKLENDLAAMFLPLAIGNGERSIDGIGECASVSVVESIRSWDPAGGASMRTWIVQNMAFDTCDAIRAECGRKGSPKLRATGRVKRGPRFSQMVDLRGRQIDPTPITRTPTTRSVPTVDEILSVLPAKSGIANEVLRRFAAGENQVKICEALGVSASRVSQLLTAMMESARGAFGSIDGLEDAIRDARIRKADRMHDIDGQAERHHMPVHREDHHGNGSGGELPPPRITIRHPAAPKAARPESPPFAALLDRYGKRLSLLRELAALAGDDPMFADDVRECLGMARAHAEPPEKRLFTALPQRGNRLAHLARSEDDGVIDLEERKRAFEHIPPYEPVAGTNNGIVLGALRKEGGWLSPDDLVRLTGLTRVQVFNCVSDLGRRGNISKRGQIGERTYSVERGEDEIGLTGERRAV